MEEEENITLTSWQIESFKYAKTTLCDVERSFSQYKRTDLFQSVCISSFERT